MSASVRFCLFISASVSSPRHHSRCPHQSRPFLCSSYHPSICYGDFKAAFPSSFVPPQGQIQNDRITGKWELFRVLSLSVCLSVFLCVCFFLSQSYTQAPTRKKMEEPIPRLVLFHSSLVPLISKAKRETKKEKKQEKYLIIVNISSMPNPQTLRLKAEQFWKNEKKKESFKIAHLLVLVFTIIR